MKTFDPKLWQRKDPVKLPMVQEQLRIEVVDVYYPEAQPNKEEKEEERRGVVVLDVF